ncbi:DUF6371 domain-containing protein [Flectobacillus roseus]
MHFRYTLDRSTPTKLFRCPLCGHKSLKRYWDNQELEYLEPIVGRCNREVNCGYHLTPRKYLGAEEYLSFTRPELKSLRDIATETPTYINWSLLEKGYKKSVSNHFIDYLKHIFNNDIALKLIETFYIGSSKYWKGSTVFWQIDEKKNIHAGKIMLYDAITGKRRKAPFNHIQWVHKAMKLEDFRLHQCFFGLHQLTRNDDRIIGIVESEKTAILMTAIMPSIVWMASGGMNLSIDAFKPLKRKKIILFPDVGIKTPRGTPFDKWRAKADILTEKGYNVTIMDALESVATEAQRQQGFDLADYLIKIDLDYDLALSEGNYPIVWDL